MKTVTRTEIADYIEQVFAEDQIATSALIDVAADAGARKEVLAVLGRLREDSYRTMSELWPELADIPVES